MESLSGFTSTSLGYFLAFLLPGSTGFLAATFYFRQPHQLLLRATSGGSNFGLVVGCFLAAFTIGLLLIPFRDRMYGERFLGRGSSYPPNEKYGNLTKPEVLVAYRMLIDDNYRYFQFWAGMSLCLPFLAIGVFRDQWHTFGGLQKWFAVGASVVIELAAVGSARQEKRDFCESVGQVLA